MTWHGPLEFALLRNLAIALFLGALVGVERERRHTDDAFGGIRTFPLISIVGALAAWLSTRYDSSLPLVVGFAAVSATGIAAYRVAAKAAPTTGATTQIAALATYLLGAVCLAGSPELAVVVAIAMTALLALRDPLHKVVGALERDDIFAGLQLLFATFIVLPLLPDTAVDPWGAIVPSRLWLLVILISAISLVGYAAMRVLGPGRGTLVTAALAGLVSSTALTASFARRSKEVPALSGALAAGILLSWTVMYGRVFVEAIVVNPSLALPLGVPLGVLAVINGGFAWFSARHANADSGSNVALTNPFSLPAAIRFGLFYGGVLLAVAVARAYLDPRWIYAIAALAAVTDVDAITLSMAALSQDPAQHDVAVRAVIVSIAANTVVKAGYVAFIGDSALRRRIALASALLVCAAGASLAAAWSLSAPPAPPPDAAGEAVETAP